MAKQLVHRDATDQQRDITTRSIQVRAATVDEQARTVEAVISTETPVEVYDWRSGEIIDEVLRGDGAMMPEQMPLLAVHSRWSLDDVLGSIRGLRQESGSILGRLHFAQDEDSERAWQKVRGGHITDVSVGYRVSESYEIQPGQTANVNGRNYTAGKRTLRVATRWTPKEGSLVPIGADQAAKIREQSGLFIRQGEKLMPPKLRAYLESIGLRKDASEEEAKTFLAQLTDEQRAAADQATQATEPPPQRQADPPASPPAGQADPDQAAQRAVEAERNRVRSIRQLAGSDVPADLVTRAIDEGWDEPHATREFLGAVRLARTPAPPVTPYHGTAQVAPMTNLTARSMAVGMMLGMGIDDPTQHSMHNGRREPRSADRITQQDAEQGDRFSRMSAVDLVRQAVLIDTGRLYWDPSEAFEAIRAASTSGGTLSYVFTTSVYARLLDAWNLVGDTTVGWCDEEDVANFLTQEDISLQANARLEQLGRGGEAKHATISDSRETYNIARYAKQFVVDEQDIIDDRLGAIMRMPAEMGEAARQLRPDLVYSLLLANPTMADTGAVFNSTAVTTAGGHANLGTAALSSTALKSAISAMVKQRINRTTADPGQALNLRPRFIIVPSDLEWTARELTAAAALAKLFADSSDPFYAQLNLLAQEGLRVVPDDRIGATGVMDPTTKAARTGSATNWFLAVGGNRGLRVAYRRGTNRQPQLRSFVLDRGQWGLGWDINMDIGAAFTEWRTWYKSTGAA
jgi:hypothetical protein